MNRPFVRRKDRPWCLQYLVSWANARLPWDTFTRTRFDELRWKPLDLLDLKQREVMAWVESEAAQREVRIYGGTYAHLVESTLVPVSHDEAYRFRWVRP